MIEGDKKYALITDHLGSVSMVVDSGTGEVVQTIDYYEFGVITSSTGDLNLHPFRFAGGLVVNGYYKF